MHVLANYSQEMASLGAGQASTLEIAARRSAEVRKRLSLAAGAPNETGDEIAAVPDRARDQQQEQQKHQHQREPSEDEFGRFFSARV